MIAVCSVPSKWWSVSLFGIVLLAIGLACILWAGPVLALLPLIFAAAMAGIGILIILVAVASARMRLFWFPLLFLGIVFLLIGLIAYLYPALVAAVVIFLLALLAIIIGILLIAYGASTPTGTMTRVLFVIIGLVPVLLGVAMIFYPNTAASILLILWGFFACIAGVLFIFQGFMLSRVRRDPVCYEDAEYTVIED